jgi:single-strand DNA-binding protein
MGRRESKARETASTEAANIKAANTKLANIEAANTVRLRGRVSSGPEERVLPSGTAIVTLRLSVPRKATPMTKGSKQASDWVDCSAWGAKPRRTALGWRPGDVVEVEGSLRRRFYRGSGGTATRLEVEILRARTVDRAPSAPG